MCHDGQANLPSLTHYHCPTSVFPCASETISQCLRVPVSVGLSVGYKCLCFSVFVFFSLYQYVPISEDPSVCVFHYLCTTFACVSIYVSQFLHVPVVVCISVCAPCFTPPWCFSDCVSQCLYTQVSVCLNAVYLIHLDKSL